jgi:hypothetical protein
MFDLSKITNPVLGKLPNAFLRDPAIIYKTSSLN